MPLFIKIAISTSACAAGAGIVGFFIWLNRREQRLGAYLNVDKDEIGLRHGVRIPLADFDKMSVVSRWELSGLGEVQMRYMVLTCKSGKEFEILVSMYNREIVALKRKVEEGMRGLLARERPSATSSTDFDNIS